MTVSNLVSPIMVYMDRFFVSALCGMNVVAYYTTPYDFVSRLTFIPEAIFGVVFPAMSKHHAGKSDELERLYRSSLKFLCICMYLISGSIVAISPLFLRVWLGPEFERQSSLILSLLAIGLFVNSMARPSYNLLQAKEMADRTAKVHLFELPIYVLVLILALKSFGLAGAAVAWVARATFDFVLLSILANRTLPRAGRSCRSVWNPIFLMFTMFLLSIVPSNSIRVSGWIFMMFFCVTYFGMFVLEKSDKDQINARVQSIGRRAFPKRP
ncbi:polysaccharide biosynthesis C-terminal domain-containing protein [Singulisphaera sp. PoT]|uniref:polysaccharide biosynthesis C-terminal domain-containing protein n=1 Tax=Singulisphaera sp. PoT TaxID=3411797 RepID=UPI003BF60CE6